MSFTRVAFCFAFLALIAACEDGTVDVVGKSNVPQLIAFADAQIDGDSVVCSCSVYRTLPYGTEVPSVGYIVSNADVLFDAGVGKRFRASYLEIDESYTSPKFGLDESIKINVHITADGLALSGSIELISELPHISNMTLRPTPGEIDYHDIEASFIPEQPDRIFEYRYRIESPSGRYFELYYQPEWPVGVAQDPNEQVSFKTCIYKMKPSDTLQAWSYRIIITSRLSNQRENLSRSLVSGSELPLPGLNGFEPSKVDFEGNLHGDGFGIFGFTQRSKNYEVPVFYEK